MVSIVRFLLNLVGFIFSIRANPLCPERCKCKILPSGIVVNCALSGHTRVPQGIPEDVKYLYLHNNKIFQIIRRDFANFNDLKMLMLGNNSLVSLGPDLFQGLGKLEFLDLALNKLQFIEPGTFSGLLRLKLLMLAHNHLTSLKKKHVLGTRKLSFPAN